MTTEDRRGEVRFRLYAIYRTLGVSTAGSNLGTEVESLRELRESAMADPGAQMRGWPRH